MSKNSRDRRPYIKPVTKLELDQSNVKLRWILASVFFVIAIVAFSVGIHEALKTEPGWQSVRAVSDQPNCGSEFVLMYDYSDLGATASQVNKALETKYSQLCTDAFAIFSPDISRPDLLNVSHVNASPNQEISVNPALYAAFDLLNRYGNRNIFLAPVYVEYNRVFRSESDPEAEDCDPAKNPEVRAYLDEMMAFISDEEMIHIELLGENRVRLHVADEYLKYAEENGIEEFIDFGWMTNAFIIDYLADRLIAEGYTNGYLVSYDGFTRNLVERNQAFHMNLFDLQGLDVYMPAVMEYTDRTALVFLRNYPLDDLDQWSTYVYADGSIVTSKINPDDGGCRSALNSMVSYSKDFGCAEILMNITPLYLADKFQVNETNLLTQKDIFSIWFERGIIYYNDPALKLELVPDSAGNLYQKILSE